MQLPVTTHSAFYTKRFRQVVAVLLKYGFSDIVGHSSISKILPESDKLVPHREGHSVFELNRFVRMRLACEELGTTFIKFGQILSNRPDILPEELIAEFERFQDRVSPVPEEQIREILESAYDKPLSEIFEFIDYHPLASASIGQVHRGVLTNGKKVVLKVMRPDITETIKADIEILRTLAQVAIERFPETQAYQPLDLVLMFERSITKELKYNTELGNLLRFKRNFEGHPEIYVPTPYTEYCTQKVLVMEYIQGIKINNRAELIAHGFDPHEIAVKGIALYFEQVFDHGFFHADPHPGNFFILYDGRICFLDFGMMGTIIEADQYLLGDLMLSLARADVSGLMRILEEFSNDPRMLDKVTLEYDIIEFFEEYSSVALDEIEGEEVMAGLNKLFFEYHIKIPQNLLLLLKALVMIEGIGLHLDPKYKIIEEMRPYIERLMARRYSPKRLLESTSHRWMDFRYLAQSLPKDIKNVVNRIKEGKITIEVEPKGWDPVYQNLDAISNRIAMAIIVAAMIMGSGLVVLSDIPPKVSGIPVIGVIGFIIAAFFAFRLFSSIRKHGKL